MISINFNPAASKSGINLSSANSELQKSLSKLSSGSRIVDSSDDAGGLAVSMKMNATGLQLGALEKNIQNSLSYLETQEGALRILGTILTRIDELEALKRDVTKNQGDIENYDKEIENLQAEIVKIREEKFNSVRLFSPDKVADSIQVDSVPLNDSIVNIIRPPLPTSFGADPLEIVILADVSGSMGQYIDAVKNGMVALISALNDSNTKSWGIKVVGYPATSGNISGASNQFIQNTNNDPLTAVISQFDSLPRHSVGQGEPLIEALDDVANISWSTNKNAKKSVFVFTDEDITKTTYAEQSRNAVAKKIKESGIDFNLLTEAHSDQWTTDLVATTGGVKGDLTDGLQNPDQFFENYAKSLIDDPFDIDDVSNYIAQNGASQSALRNLKDSTEITQINTHAARSRITDVDIASESTKLARFQILQQASTSILSQANLSHQSLLKLLNVT